VPATADTVYALASVTKVFTATAVMMLVEEGKLSLDDTVGKLLPQLPAEWHGVTVRQLLSHTSGLPDVIVDPRNGTWIAETQDEALQKVSRLPLQFKPGESWNYNQTNYMLLGMLIEKLAGKRTEEVLAERFFRPLGITSTTYGDSQVVVPGRGPWYTRLAWEGNTPKLLDTVRIASIHYPDYMHTAAGLNSTVGDLVRWNAAFDSGKLLKPATQEQMWTAIKLNNGDTFRMEKTLGVGMGWLVDDKPGHKAVGGTGGATVAFRRYLADKLTVILLTNCQGIDPDAMVDEIAALYMPELSQE
jgi:CubicO group peptidase (beta-lactamase class C family)